MSAIDDISSSPSELPDVVCFSHLRWDFVFQRPQHLLTRYAQRGRVLYVEEPVVVGDGSPRLFISSRLGLDVAVPHLPGRLNASETVSAMRGLIDGLWASQRLERPVLWYYSPMALDFTDHLESAAIVYDCMDELSAFKGAPEGLQQREARLFECASLVLTGGRSLYEAKRLQYRREHLHVFPSSVDVSHFGRARRALPSPVDQKPLRHPRLGFFGVLDERLDVQLLDGVAAARPNWQFVMIGPVVKIDPALLPRRANIHYLGSKRYDELPAYLAGWDVALLPFARNEATRFISPTKTPEYLAAGRPVVSTSIRDVVQPFGEAGLVHIADDVDTFVRACEAALAQNRAAHRTAADTFLRTTSWDATWSGVETLLRQALARNTGSQASPEAIAV